MKRLDVFLFEQGKFPSRERAKEAILSGEFLINGKQVKPSEKVVGIENIEISCGYKYVSRGALKLKKAVEVFDVNLKGRSVIDIGSSTGGFTEVCLENGASKVVAVDVGKNQLHEKLRGDSRIELYEDTDFRDLTKDIICGVNLVVSDVSFISLRHIFPKIVELFGNNIECIMLFKPQFECGREIANKFKGVIKDKEVHKRLLKDFIEYLKVFGFKISNIDYSPITGKSGNIEYLLHIDNIEKNLNINQVVDKAFQNFKLC